VRKTKVLLDTHNVSSFSDTVSLSRRYVLSADQQLEAT
jgi:hypothetical protein